jgi:hypothetical protein
MTGEKRKHVGYWLERKKERDHLGRPRHRWVNNIKMDLRCYWMVWIGLMWLRIGTSGGLLSTQ